MLEPHLRAIHFGFRGLEKYMFMPNNCIFYKHKDIFLIYIFFTFNYVAEALLYFADKQSYLYDNILLKN